MCANAHERFQVGVIANQGGGIELNDDNDIVLSLWKLENCPFQHLSFTGKETNTQRQ